MRVSKVFWRQVARIFGKDYVLQSLVGQVNAGYRAQATIVALGLADQVTLKHTKNRSLANVAKCSPDPTLKSYQAVIKHTRKA